ncbi:MAG: hypothetical protein ACOCP8_02165 [archaeon]
MEINNLKYYVIIIFIIISLILIYDGVLRDNLLTTIIGISPLIIIYIFEFVIFENN